VATFDELREQAEQEIRARAGLSGIRRIDFPAIGLGMLLHVVVAEIHI
jgi:hypothetical protein